MWHGDNYTFTDLVEENTWAGYDSCPSQRSQTPGKFPELSGSVAIPCLQFWCPSDGPSLEELSDTHSLLMCS